MKKQIGFTLVELAIVLMIIGLLIGGILKGQELITNARITSAARMLKNLDAAVITFRDAYNALPGDIANPSSRLPNCSAASCNVAGNGNGMIGTSGAEGDENNTFWLHLLAANLISGVDPNSTWTSGTYYAASSPAFPLGGVVTIRHNNVAAGVAYPEGVFGYGWRLVRQDASSIYGIPLNYFGRWDNKFDDGKPWSGDILIGSAGCGIATGITSYDPSLTALCSGMQKSAF